MSHDAKTLAAVAAILECRTARRELEAAKAQCAIMPTVQNKTREYIAFDKWRASVRERDTAVMEASK